MKTAYYFILFIKKAAHEAELQIVGFLLIFFSSTTAKPTTQLAQKALLCKTGDLKRMYVFFQYISLLKNWMCACVLEVLLFFLIALSSFCIR